MSEKELRERCMNNIKSNRPYSNIKIVKEVGLEHLEEGHVHLEEGHGHQEGEHLLAKKEESFT